MRETIDRPITSELSAVKDGGRTMGELQGRLADIILLCIIITKGGFSMEWEVIDPYHK